MLLSGGLDSCVAATLAKQSGEDVFALSIAYGQRHSCELDAARFIANELNIPLHLVRADISSVVGSALLGSQAVPVGRDIDQIKMDAKPATLVPARNAMFLSIAAAFAVSVGAPLVCIGSNKDDASGYPDCRPEFFRSFEMLSYLGGFLVDIWHPLTTKTKRDVVALGLEIGAPIDLSWSCYSPAGVEGAETPCGNCDACTLRSEALR